MLRSGDKVIVYDKNIAKGEPHSRFALGLHDTPGTVKGTYRDVTFVPDQSDALLAWKPTLYVVEFKDINFPNRLRDQAGAPHRNWYLLPPDALKFVSAP